MDIQAELLKATGVKPKRRKEDEQDYLARVKAAVDELDEDSWEALSGAAQDWANNAENAKKAGTPLPAMNGTVGNGGAGPVEAAGEAEEEEAPKRRRAAGGKKAAAKATKAKATEAKGKKAKGGSAQARSTADTKIKKLVKELPPGNRNEHWSKVRDGTKIGDIRKDKTLLRVTRYWRRKGYVEFVTPAA